MKAQTPIHIHVYRAHLTWHKRRSNNYKALTTLMANLRVHVNRYKLMVQIRNHCDHPVQRVQGRRL